MTNELALTKTQQNLIANIPSDDDTKLNQTMRNQLVEVFERVINSRKMMLDKKKHEERLALKQEYIDANPTISSLLADLERIKQEARVVIRALSTQGVDTNGSVIADVESGEWFMQVGYRVRHYNESTADKAALEESFEPATDLIDAVADTREAYTDPFAGALIRLQCASTFGEARLIINTVAGDTII